ncbi:probable LRR receptor-like serine/threonine-protein kinase At2g16250 [Phragmites australis]|uniref:probable LRR receptor-like serine/threonine-protein kinase At2g16250 n=1 Tax=Phragmites australis TaxID=29695 RepID=UPI002D76CBF3|nr:probable LRR receptor-like serine/threonine-protein kinase At2g16250 [Phragmites australis]
MLPRCLVVGAVLFLLLHAAVAQGQRPLAPQDVAALYGLRASLGVRARDWPARADPCAAWLGVACRAGRVAELRLAGLRRTRAGEQRAAFAVEPLRGLTALEAFNASGFPLPGWIPAWFGRGLLPSLSVIDLSSAQVNGELPADLGMSCNLTTLVLSGNSLSGRIPASLFLISGLRFLDLSSNNLTGELPNVSFSAGEGTGILFNASGNSLYGSIGDAIGSLKRRFKVVDVSSNYFGQVVGTGFGNGTDGTVDFEMNCLSGIASQRSRGDCEAFYKRNGVRLVEVPESSSPLAEPQPPQVPPMPSPGKRGVKWKYILAGVLGGAAIVVVLSLIALVFCLMRRRGRRRPRGRGGVEQTEEGIRSGRRSSSVNPVTMSPMASPGASGSPKGFPTIIDGFTYEQLHHATGGFGDDNLVKHGQSGDIYHGVLESGFQVVIKKIDVKSSKKSQGELGFLAKNSHGRIVPLLGHLAKDGDELLVYKYMTKGDLTHALHKNPADAEDGLRSLDWITRLKIAIGVAEALCFLHDECSPPLVHRDIQASSVLLDDKFEVRLGSLSEICPQQNEGSQSFFSRILRSSKSLDKNTSGPPASCSYDVYCFGKVLLELITGNFGASGSNDADSDEWLAGTLGYIDANDKESVSGIVDPSLVVDEDHLEEVWAVAIVAKTCLNSKPSRRPLARYILKALENPLKVVREREELRSDSSRLKSTSSRSSWRSAFHGKSYRSWEVMPTSGKALARKNTAKLQGTEGSDGEEENVFSFKRASREIFPDPVELEDNVVV